MNQVSLDVKQLNTKSAPPPRISAKKNQSSIAHRPCQADIFKDIDVLERVKVSGGTISIKTLFFPFVICLNQECDLEQDYNSRISNENKVRLLHCAVAPVFLFKKFLVGDHWGEIFPCSAPCGSKIADKIRDNETPRYHYLKFPDTNTPELIVDFKHFFTIDSDYLYDKIPDRFCSMSDLFREQVSHRFSYYISRIGLPFE